MRFIALVMLGLATAACGSIEQLPSSKVDGTGFRVGRKPAFATDANLDPVALGIATRGPGALAPPPMRAEDKDDVGKPYTSLRLAAFDPSGDISSLDTGFAADLSFGNKFLSFLALEGSVGYLEAGIPGGGDKLWGIPLFANARLSLPILILEPYAGAGVGGIYTEFPGDTDWVGAWNAFAGVGVGLGQLALGIDYHYLRSEDTSANFAIEGHSLGAFVSLPF